VSPEPTGYRSGSKGVAWTNWLVAKAAGALERRSSRRGFLVGSAMVGSAVAVARLAPMVRTGSPYTFITDCGGGLCTDGYTEFCCTINNGVNACPPDSFPGGWWRADFSSFCNGTRYYIDCMQFCCGPRTGFGFFCAGCSECRCADGCDTRRVYCNYFRYGQCYQLIVASGPIACRVVLCTPPYALDPACSPAAAVDNSTAEHTSPCLTDPPPSPPPPPPVPKFALTGEETMGFTAAVIPGVLWETFRVDGQGNVWHHWYPRGSAGEREITATGATPNGDVRVVRQTTPQGGVGRADVWFERPDGTLGHTWQLGDGVWTWQPDGLQW
jgi:hypothetical protein